MSLPPSRETYAVDTIVIGAGVVGLAVARALALAGRDVVILEAEGHIGEHQSSRNSEVVHAGIYYAPGSLKARFCIEGKTRLYAYCADRGVTARAVGKLVVATSDEQVRTLESIRANAAACGMPDLDMIDGVEARRLEPALSAVAALWSPTSGIVDSHAYMLALLGDAEAAGATLAVRAPVEHVHRNEHAIEVEVGGADPARMSCRLLVNCAGAHAPALARRIEGFPPDTIPESSFAKGNYFSLQGRAPFSRLVYPVPEPGGLGVHLTIDLGGQARFGPDVQWIDTYDYAVDPHRADAFYAEIRRYWPALPDGTLTPAYAGIRAKIGPRSGKQDFVVSTPAEHGVPGVVCLYGIESPGLTASLALADHVVQRIAASA